MTHLHKPFSPAGNPGEVEEKMFGIPKKVFDLVLALAESYGHLWARYAREAGAPEDVEFFREFVRSRSNEDGYDDGGILAPNILYNEYDGFIYSYHNGELEWTIWSDSRGEPVVFASVNRPGIEGVLVVHPNAIDYGIRHQAGSFGQRHIRALRDFIKVAIPHVPDLEGVLARLAELEGEARRHDTVEAQHLLWNTPLEELQWAKPALEDALGSVLANEAAQEFSVLLRAVNAARTRWAELVAQYNLEKAEA